MNLDKNALQAIILYISSLAGVLIGVLSSVINTRYLSPQYYGDVRYVQNIINFFSCIFLLGYFVSGCRLLAVANNKMEQSGIKGVMAVYLFKTILMMIGILFLCYGWHTYFKQSFDASLFIIAIPVCSQPLLLNYINTTSQGDNQIGRIALARVLPASFYVIIAWFVYNNMQVTSSMMILLQWGIAVIVLSCIIISSKPSFYQYNRFKLALKKENKEYGIQLYWGSLAMVATQYISGITLGLYNADNRQVAFFTLALTVSMPLSMLPSIVGTTYFKRFATENTIPKEVIKGTVLLTIASLVGFVILINPIVNFLYPESYSQVGLYASILAVGKCIHGTGDMINRFLGAHRFGKDIRNASFVTGFFLVFGSFIIVYYYSIWGAVATNVIASTAYTLCLIYYYLKYLKKRK